MLFDQTKEQKASLVSRVCSAAQKKSSRSVLLSAAIMDLNKMTDNLTYNNMRLKAALLDGSNAKDILYNVLEDPSRPFITV